MSEMSSLLTGLWLIERALYGEGLTGPERPCGGVVQQPPDEGAGHDRCVASSAGSGLREPVALRRNPCSDSTE